MRLFEVVSVHVIPYFDTHTWSNKQSIIRETHESGLDKWADQKSRESDFERPVAVMLGHLSCHFQGLYVDVDSQNVLASAAL